MKQRTVQNTSARATATPTGRGFLLLVVIGILAVLLTVCIGFLSYTRGEIMAVSSQRNKSDTQDLMRSALDFTLSNICADQMDSSTDSMDETKPLAYTVNPGSTAGTPWWFRTMQLGTCNFLPRPDNVAGGGWGFGLKPATQPGAETQWLYFPADYFPGGAVRGRAQVQVFDTNAFININDWNEDGNPSQAQMAHMIIDAYGYLRLENMRRYRDTAINGNALPNNPLRYHEAWRVASHSARYMAWPDWDSKDAPNYLGAQVNNTASFSFVTQNSSWLSMYGPQYSCLSAIIQSDGLPLAQTTACQPYEGSKMYATVNPVPSYQGDRSAPTGCFGPFNSGNPQSAGYLPWGMAGFYTMGYTDPDTGRSPVNINTCYNSGETLPFDYWNNPPCYTMEGVWNTESLRRVIKVGYFWDPWSTNYIDPLTKKKTAHAAGYWSNAQRDWVVLDPRAKMLVETLKLQLAYQYQETLCRYFTGSYAHGGQGQKFPPFSNTAINTYAATYTQAPLPAHACTVTDYSAPRFPVSLTAFRKNVHDDFINCLTQNYTNPAYTAAGNTASIPARPAGQADAANTDGTVNFTYTSAGSLVYIPEIAPGKLDMRTACACYDNMIPGKPANITDFTGCTPYGAGDPLFELFALQVGRQEDMDDGYQIDPSVIHDSAVNGIQGTDVRTSRNKLGANGNPPYPLASVPNPAKWPVTTQPWPLNAASPVISNVNSRWVDNPKLSATSFYLGFSYPNTGNEAQLYDHHRHELTLMPKGNDLCSWNAIDSANATVFNSAANPTLNGVPVPAGPWLDDMNVNLTGTGFSKLSPGYNQMNRIGSNEHDVPWRQLCFTPDSFSTELTTASTTFLLVLNTQLVDQSSINANPANTALHTDQAWNQWGMVVQIAPDVKAETSPNEPVSKNMFFTNPANPNMQTVNGPAAPDAQFFGWYRNEMPRRIKTYTGTLPMTDPNWLVDSYLDDTCPTLVGRNRGNTASYTQPFGRTSDQCRIPWNDPHGGLKWADFNPPLVGNSPETEHSSATHVRDWKKTTNPGEITTGCDINQVPPAGVPSGRGADAIYGPAVGGGAAPQTKKRVIIRSIWCLNEGIEQ